MSVFNRVMSWRRVPSSREITSLVRTLIDRCEPAVWERVAGRAARMAPAEARGYIRARSAGIVRDQVQRLLAANAHWQATVQADILDQATHGLVRQVHHRLLNAQHPIVERRQAA